MEKVTLEKMRLAIKNVCEKEFPGLCYKKDRTMCPLFDNGGSCYCDDRLVEKHYKILVRKGYIKDENPYWKNITELANKQRKKGIDTYGQGIESNPEEVHTRIRYIEEELIDALMYLEWLKEGLTSDRKEDI